MTTGWHVVQTHPHGEARAAGNLRRQGFETYLPCIRVSRSHARRIEMVRRPLFPGYLFVSFDPEQQPWRAILSTFGVARLLGHGDRPAAVPMAVVDDVRGREDKDGFVQLPVRPFRTGDRLKVVGGPFDGLFGLCQGMSEHDRVAMLLDLLGRAVRVSLPAIALEAAV